MTRPPKRPSRPSWTTAPSCWTRSTPRSARYVVLPSDARRRRGGAVDRRHPRRAGLERRTPAGDQGPGEALRQVPAARPDRGALPPADPDHQRLARPRSTGPSAHDPTDPPTLLIDEADTIFGPKAADDHEDLRGLLNAGHQRGRPAIRWDAGRRQLDEIATFALVALAGIGDMPDTIEDRAVIITMRRRAPDEHVQPYRTRRDGPALHQLRGRLAPLGPRPARPARRRRTRPCRSRTGPPTPGNPSSRSPTPPAATGPTPPAPPSSP